MEALWPKRTNLLSEYEEAIDSFERAVAQCSDERWVSSLWVVPRTDPWVWPKEGTAPVAHRTEDSIQVFSACWYVATHCAFFLDFYLSHPDNIESFRAQPPFEAAQDEGFEEDGAIELPQWRFTRAQVLEYIHFGRDKARALLPMLTEEVVGRTMPEHHPWAGASYAQLLNVNLDHLKEHAPQIVD